MANDADLRALNPSEPNDRIQAWHYGTEDAMSGTPSRRRVLAAGCRESYDAGYDEYADEDPEPVNADAPRHSGGAAVTWTLRPDLGVGIVQGDCVRGPAHVKFEGRGVMSLDPEALAPA